MIPIPRSNFKSEPLLLVGASCRAMAESALLAGFAPIAIDQFSDLDLEQIAHVIPLPDYPNSLIEACSEFQGVPIVYGGGLENRARTLHKLARQHPLWGIQGESLRILRNPFEWTRIFREQGHPTLEVRAEKTPPQDEEIYLLKPIRGAGGRGIHFWNATQKKGVVSEASLNPTTSNDKSETSPTPLRPREPYYFQRFAEGDSFSALFIARPESLELIGITKQLVGIQQPFSYSGNILIPAPSPAMSEQLQRLGITLKNQACPIGLFGIDFIWDGKTAWVVEINPRYTASVELFERASGRALLFEHASCFGFSRPKPGSMASKDPTHSSPSRIQTLSPIHPADQDGVGRAWGKVVLYASRDLITPDYRPLLNEPPPRRIADIPRPGIKIPEGHPVFTMFAVHQNPTDTELELRTCVHERFGSP